MLFPLWWRLLVMNRQTQSPTCGSLCQQCWQNHQFSLTPSSTLVSILSSRRKLQKSSKIFSVLCLVEGILQIINLFYLLHNAHRKTTEKNRQEFEESKMGKVGSCVKTTSVMLTDDHSTTKVAFNLSESSVLYNSSNMWNV